MFAVERSLAVFPIRKTRLFKYVENFATKNWKFSDKNSDIFSYLCSKHRLWILLKPSRRGGSKEYQQSMFLSSNKKNNLYPCKPQFYCIKVEIKGMKCTQVCFRDALTFLSICKLGFLSFVLLLFPIAKLLPGIMSSVLDCDLSFAYPYLLY